ncbi:hypothetical protein DFH09DRAFT_1226610, partial [Mycena vulgaris]
IARPRCCERRSPAGANIVGRLLVYANRRWVRDACSCGGGPPVREPPIFPAGLQFVRQLRGALVLDARPVAHILQVPALRPARAGLVFLRHLREQGVVVRHARSPRRDPRRPHSRCARTVVVFLTFTLVAWAGLFLPVYNLHTDVYFDLGLAALALEPVFGSRDLQYRLPREAHVGFDNKTAQRRCALFWEVYSRDVSGRSRSPLLTSPPNSPETRSRR